MKKIKWLFMACLLLGATVGGADVPKGKINFQNLVKRHADAYYAQQVQVFNGLRALGVAKLPQSGEHRCEPLGPSCMEVGCEKLGSFGCDSLNEIQELGRGCRGNYNGVCLQKLCSYLGSFGCDSMSEIVTVAASCVGNTNGTCIDFVCARLGSFGCDSIAEITEVAKTCRGED